MPKENAEIRTLAREAGVQLWRIAAELGVSEPTITRWLRLPLSAERRKAIIDAIGRLSKEVK